MKKQLALALFGTALASLPAMAQVAPANPAANTGPATSTTPTSTTTRSDRNMVVKPGQWRASKLTGLNVYNNANDKVGDINEVVVGRDGKIESVVIGVGGFLGMGEHDVAVPFGQVKFVEEAQRNDGTASATGTREQNEAAQARNNAAARLDVSRNATARASNPARAPETTGTTNRTAANNESYRGYPDHAVVNMSKDQLKALPEVRYR